MTDKLIVIANLYSTGEIQNFKIRSDRENSFETVELYFTVNVDGFDGYEECYNCELDKFTLTDFYEYKEKKTVIFKNWCLGEVM